MATAFSFWYRVPARVRFPPARINMAAVTWALPYIAAFLLCSSCYASNAVRNIGDILQVANPVATFVFARSDSERLLFAAHYALSMGLVGIGKSSGRHFKYPLALRPDKSAYTGMPSGHTASAWTAASFTRNPFLYATAVFTGFSRIHAKKHTILQVCVSIVIAESIVLIPWWKVKTHNHVNFSVTPQSLQVVFAF